MVFRDAFLKSAEAGRMGVPTAPLSELYGAAADTFARAAARFCCAAQSMRSRAAMTAVTLRSNDREFSFDYAISAVPFHASRAHPAAIARPARSCSRR